MRRNKLRKDNKIGFHFEGLSLKNVVVREANPVDSFYIEETISSDDDKKCVAHTDPIRMLFNQERLNKLGNMAVEQWLNSLQNFKKDPLAELRAKCSDEDLKAMIKYRHLQQPSEIMAWAEYCQANMDTFNAEVQKLVQARQEEEAKKVEKKVEPVTTD